MNEKKPKTKQKRRNQIVPREEMMRSFLLALLLAIAFSSHAAKNDSPSTFTGVLGKEDGYRGIWYFNQPQKDEYVYKYSGGLGTYCADHIPLACYAKEVNKTFFVYGGGGKDGRSLHAMVSYFDHNTGLAPRPTDLLDKQTNDAHDNPVIALDSKGYVWVFAAAHGAARPAYIFRSREPYSIASFDLIQKTSFSYPQPWYLEGRGFLFLHTRYDPAHSLYWSTSADGMQWSEPHKLAGIEQGHYQVSWPWKDKVGTAFNYHPKVGGLNARTNLYYVETADFGRTWRNIKGEPVDVPLRSIANNALVRDYAAEKLLVYICDIQYDSEGRPIILYVTSHGYQAGPQNGPRIWTTAHWTGEKWEIAGSIQSDSNYDMGSLYVQPDGAWQIIAPTEPGPQPFNPGGEAAVWGSRDNGKSWAKEKQLTHDSEFNHTYVRRPVNAHPDFYAFWADGHARRPSESRLYFADKSGNVYRLPTQMTKDFERPELMK